jgi:NitT/TauT family transport system permease protein
MTKALRIWQAVILVVLFTLWQVLAQPDLLPPFVWENPNRAAFFFGEPVKIFKAIWIWFSEGAIYQHLWVTLEETALAFVIGSYSARKAVVNRRPSWLLLHA